MMTTVDLLLTDTSKGGTFVYYIPEASPYGNKWYISDILNKDLWSFDKKFKTVTITIFPDQTANARDSSHFLFEKFCK